VRVFGTFSDKLNQPAAATLLGGPFQLGDSWVNNLNISITYQNNYADYGGDTYETILETHLPDIYLPAPDIDYDYLAWLVFQMLLGRDDFCDLVNSCWT